MTGFMTITKLLLRNMLRRGQNKKESGAIWVAYIALGIMYVFIAGSLVAMTYMMSNAFYPHGLLSPFLSLLLSIGCLAVLFFGLPTMLNVIYFSRDTEFFMALPIRPSTVYLAKLFIVYVGEAGLSILLLLPCLLTAGIVTHMQAIYYICLPIILLTVPAIPLLLASLIAIPLMYVVSFFRNKGVLSSIVLILLFGLFFGGYMLLVNNIGNVVDGFNPDAASLDAIVTAMEKPMTVAANVLFPLLAISRFATMTDAYGVPLGASMAIDGILYIACIAALILLTMLISNAVYKRSAEKMLETGKHKVSEKTSYSATGVIKTLMKKEWRELIRTPAYAFQSLSGIVLCPIVLIAMGFAFRNGFSEAGGEAETELAMMAPMLIFLMIGFLTMMGVGMNVGAATCISREGLNFSSCKMIPVPPKEQLRAKSYLYMIVSAASIVTGLIPIPFMGIPWWTVFPALGFLVLYAYGYVHFVIYFDLKRPKLHWATPNEAVKQNRSAVIPMFVNMGCSAVLMIVPTMFTLLIPIPWLGQLLAWILLYAVGLLVAFLFPSLLYNNADQLFEQITV